MFSVRKISDGSKYRKDDKESGYDDSQERRELEKAADMLFG